MSFNVSHAIHDEFQKLYSCGTFCISPTHTELLSSVVNGACEVLAKNFNKFNNYLIVSLKAVACGTFVAIVLQKQICQDKRMHLLKYDGSVVSLADLCVQIVIIEVMTLCAETCHLKMIAEENFDLCDSKVLEQTVQILNQILPLPLLYAVLHTDITSSPLESNWNQALILEHFHQITKIDQNSFEHCNTQPDKNLCIILDPIDGTKGFVRDAQFAVALGLFHIESGNTVLSIVACPNLEKLTTQNFDSESIKSGILYYAVKDQGARCVNLFTLKNSNVLLLSKEIPKNLRFVTSAESKHTREESIVLCHQHCEPSCPLQVFRLDSMAKYCLIAQGWANVFLRYPNPEYHEYIWDVLPGALIVEEAGGVVTHGDGSAVVYSFDWKYPKLRNVSGLVVTGEGGLVFHQLVLNALKKKNINEIKT